MSAKEYLNQVGLLDARLKAIDTNVMRIRRELYAMEDISLNSSWGNGQPQGTKLGDPTGEKAARLADTISEKKNKLKAQLQKYEYDQIMLRSELWAKRIEIIESLEKIINTDDPMSRIYYRLLMLRYIEGLSWEAIALDIGYTWRHTIRLHGTALSKMEEVIR